MKATWEDFLRAESFPGLLEGAEVLTGLAGYNIGTAGFAEAARGEGHELKPIAWASAVPSSYVTEDAFERMSRIVLERLEAARPYDAVYLDLHGAMVAEHLQDGEGELVRRVRALVGPDMPVVVSLDLHSNTTEAMLQHADGLIAYRTYPHVDMAATGRRAYGYLQRLLDSGRRPAKARRAVPFLMPLTGQCTMDEPMAGVYRRLEQIEREAGVWHVSFTPGFPPADIWDCGPVVVAYADDQASADRAADALHAYIMQREAAFRVPFLSPGEAIAKAMRSNAHRPYVLADVQDNCGAGATSDTTGLLRAMVERQPDRCVLGLLVDPEAAAAAHAAGEGAEIEIAVGGKRFTAGDPPFRARFTVTRLGDGRITCTGPMYGGARLNLGPMALLSVGSVGVIVSTNRMQAADQALFRHLGIEPTAQKIVGLKSSVHFRADFVPIAEEVLVVECAGAFVDQPEKLPYRNLRPGVRLGPGGRPHAG
jgi:microcystin degradation protein MlrC